MTTLSPAWIASQRWFGGKARSIERLSVEDVVPIDPAADAGAFIILDVHYQEAIRGQPVERYALLGDAAVTDAGWVEQGGDPGAIRTVVRALVAGARLSGLHGGEIAAADVTEAARGNLGGDRITSIPIRPLGFEQSNTSLRIGTDFVLKVIRRLHEGEHPQLEIGRFLTRFGFQHAPPLHGSMTYRGATGGQHALVALEGWVPNVGDGWRYVLDALETRSASALTTDLFRLGAITAAFHVAMASDASNAAFAPEPVSERDLDEWRGAAEANAARVLKVVEQDLPSWPAAAARLGRLLLDRRGRLVARLDARDLARSLSALRKIRVHGDFHLGQTLKTADGFVLIDFEGEPARSLAERRQKLCALKDVAGLLRSLDYAEATVSPRVPAAAGAARTLSQSFLDGYYSEPGLHAFLPLDRRESSGLLTFFELEKALYEIEYEVNNRPDWLHIPLAAVVRALDAPP